MNRVFVPQRPSRYDRDAGAWVPTLDISPAEKFGKIVYMLPEGFHKITSPVMQALDDMLVSFHEDDMILAHGDPGIILAVGWLLGQRNMKKVSLLKWDRFTSDYSLVEVKR